MFSRVFGHSHDSRGVYRWLIVGNISNDKRVIDIKRNSVKIERVEGIYSQSDKKLSHNPKPRLTFSYRRSQKAT